VTNIGWINVSSSILYYLRLFCACEHGHWLDGAWDQVQNRRISSSEHYLKDVVHTKYCYNGGRTVAAVQSGGKAYHHCLYRTGLQKPVDSRWGGHLKPLHCDTRITRCKTFLLSIRKLHYSCKWNGIGLKRFLRNRLRSSFCCLCLIGPVSAILSPSAAFTASSCHFSVYWLTLFLRAVGAYPSALRGKYGEDLRTRTTGTDAAFYLGPYLTVPLSPWVSPGNLACITV